MYGQKVLFPQIAVILHQIKVRRNIAIQIKAALLLLIFSLNTLVGFACVMGADMWFDSHHHEEEVTDVQESSHHHNKSQHHDESGNQKSKNGNDNCCNDKVIKFDQDDKAVPPSSNTGIGPVFVTTFIFSFCDMDVLYSSLHIQDSKYFARNYHPPIPDIRIAIQSFQI